MVIAAAVVPAVAAFVRVVGQRWYPAGDWAML